MARLRPVRAAFAVLLALGWLSGCLSESEREERAREKAQRALVQGDLQSVREALVDPGCDEDPAWSLDNLIDAFALLDFSIKGLQQVGRLTSPDQPSASICQVQGEVMFMDIAYGKDV